MSEEKKDEKVVPIVKEKSEVGKLIDELVAKNQKFEQRELEINSILETYEKEARELLQERTLNAATHRANNEVIERLMPMS